MSRDLKNARKSLNDGRVDEALLYLWNALESARLEGGRALQELERLAVAAAQQGDESQKAEAQRLLESLREVPAVAEEVESATVQEAAPPDTEEEEGSESAPPPEREPEPDAEPPRAQRNLGRYAIPAIFLLIVVVNLLARAFGD